MSMSDLNKWIGEGRLTRDCGSNERDFAYIQNGGDGLAVATVSIAVNRNRKKGNEYVDDVSFFDIKIYGKTAENLKPYLTKGQLIRVEGVLKQDRWQDKQTGNNMSKIYINAESVRLIGGKRDDNGQNGYQQNTAYNGYTPPQTTTGQYQPNGIGQVQQMAGQTVQTRQAQQIQPHNDGFQEDLDFGKNEYPDNYIPF